MAIDGDYRHDRQIGKDLVGKFPEAELSYGSRNGLTKSQRMMPVVDPQVQLWSEHLSGGIEALSLQTFLSEPRHVHVLRAVHVSPARDASRSGDEARWIEQVASTPGSGGLPNGLIAAIDLTGSTVVSTVSSLAKLGRVRGFRPIGRPDQSAVVDQLESLMTDCSNDVFELLAGRGLLLDLQAHRCHLCTIADLARRHPSLSIVVSGGGSTFLAESSGAFGLDDALSRIGSCVRVSVKLCGFRPSEAIRPSIDGLIDRLGVERLMFASGYPVRHHRQDYDGIWQDHAVATMHRSARERDALFRNSAMRIYRL